MDKSFDEFSEGILEQQKSFVNYNLETLEQTHKIKKRILEMRLEETKISSQMMSKDEYFFVHYLAPGSIVLLAILSAVFSFVTFSNQKYIESSAFMVVSILALSVVYLINSGKLGYIEIPKVIKAGTEKKADNSAPRNL